MPQITPECEYVRAKKIDDSAVDFTQTDQDKLFSLGHDLLETISSKDFQLILWFLLYIYIFRESPQIV